MKDKLIIAAKTIPFIGLVAVLVYIFVYMPRPEKNRYEVHAFDGKIYYTSNVISNSNYTIQFYDEKTGYLIKLGGGYTIIKIK